MTQTQFSFALYLEVLGLFPDEAGDAGYAAKAFANRLLLQREYGAERRLEEEESMRHVRQTAEYQRYGAWGVYGKSK